MRAFISERLSGIPDNLETVARKNYKLTWLRHQRYLKAYNRKPSKRTEIAIWRLQAHLNLLWLIIFPEDDPETRMEAVVEAEKAVARLDKSIKLGYMQAVYNHESLYDKLAGK